LSFFYPPKVFLFAIGFAPLLPVFIFPLLCCTFLMCGIASSGFALLAMTVEMYHVIASERSERGNLLHGARTVAALSSCVGLLRASPSSQ